MPLFAKNILDALPDPIIILDWMIPKISGIEICYRLRQQTSTKKQPIIMLTARGEEGDRIKGLESGAGYSLDDKIS